MSAASWGESCSASLKIPRRCSIFIAYSDHVQQRLCCSLGGKRPEVVCQENAHTAPWLSGRRFFAASDQQTLGYHNLLPLDAFHAALLFEDAGHYLARRD